jgi:hypothetical protein
MLKIQADDPFAFDVIFRSACWVGKKEKNFFLFRPFIARLHSFYCSFLVHLANAQLRGLMSMKIYEFKFNEHKASSVVIKHKVIFTFTFSLGSTSAAEQEKVFSCPARDGERTESSFMLCQQLRIYFSYPLPFLAE